MASTPLKTLFTNKVWLTLGLMLCSYSITPSYAANNSELKGVSGEISRQKQSLSSQQKKLDSLQKSLKSQEITITRLEKEIKESKASLANTNKNIRNLESKVDQLEQQKKAQSDKLAELIQTYYVTQRAKTSSNILNQGVEEDRISQYFQHLAKERATTIAELEKTVDELDDSREQLKLEKQQITNLL